MQEGTIKWFNPEKGIGFITPTNDGPDVFLHHSQIVDKENGLPAEGDHVVFDILRGEMGPKAARVIRS